MGGTGQQRFVKSNRSSNSHCRLDHLPGPIQKDPHATVALSKVQLILIVVGELVDQGLTQSDGEFEFLFGLGESSRVKQQRPQASTRLREFLGCIQLVPASHAPTA